MMESRICDYEGSDYKTEFWEKGGREYEDLAERIALRRLLPQKGSRLIDLGAGFGRLADLYGGYEEVVLLDYSRSMLHQARERLGESCIYVAANLYNLPLNDACFDAAVTIRLLHHVQDIPAALGEIRRIIRPGGAYIIEYANKCHLKAILRYLLGRQNWNPFSLEPVEFSELHYDFHPTFMRESLNRAGFRIERELAVSYLRLPFLKRFFPARFLAACDGALQWTGAFCKLSPSVFLRARASGESGSHPLYPGEVELFRCPHCHGAPLKETSQSLDCPLCGRRWPIREGIYDFKESLPKN